MAAPDPPPDRFRRSTVRWFFANPRTGKVVLAQWPNPPLAIYLAATVVRALAHPKGSAGTVVSTVETAALLWWAALEVVRGDSPFRRVLGTVIFVVTVATLIGR